MPAAWWYVEAPYVALVPQQGTMCACGLCLLENGNDRCPYCQSTNLSKHREKRAPSRDQLMAEADARLARARDAGRATVTDFAPPSPVKAKRKRRSKTEMQAVRAAAAERQRAAYLKAVPGWLQQADREADEELERLTS